MPRREPRTCELPPVEPPAALLSCGPRDRNESLARFPHAGTRYGWHMAIFDVPKRFSRQWVRRKEPQMDSTEFHAMFHEAAARGWDEAELRQLARMWADESASSELKDESR